MRKTIHTPEGLDTLPDGSVILDTGLRATKRNGCWDYGDGQFWEPQNFPVHQVPEL